VAEADPLWAAVARLVATAASDEDLIHHRLSGLAVRQRRAAGIAVPEALDADARMGDLAEMTSTPLLLRVREACDAPLILTKGPELARRYPEPAARPYRDLDLVTTDMHAAQSALLAAGFRPLREEPLRPGLQHLDALVSPGLPLALEMHDRPKWPTWAASTAPRAGELLAHSTPADHHGVDGLRTLEPAAHAVVVAAHAWAHRPLRRVLDLIDLGVLLRECDIREAEQLARRWGVERIWRCSARATSDLLAGTRRSVPLRTWAGDLRSVEERGPARGALERWLAPFSERPPLRAVHVAGRAIARDVLPEQLRRRRSG
jgi:hypothetical protein